MRVIKSRRPKSALNAVKQKLYTPFISQSRLSGIQKICETEGLDCVLIILGIDSRFNRGCTELIEYLLFDMLDTRKDEIQRTNADEILFEDLMICVHQNFVEIYCNPVNYWLLLPYMAHWPGLRLHCLSEAEYYDDPDKAEDFKVEVLNRMVSRAKTIGVPYFSSREDMQKLKFDKMLVEQWPVVQATALEEISGGPGSGFFTLNHSVVDVSSHVHSLLREIDAVYLEAFYNKVLPPFEKQFESMFQIMDMHRNDIQEWTSSRFAEPLMSYFQHGCAVLGCAEMKTKFCPFLLFGKATEKAHLLPALRGQAPTDGAATPQAAPTHFVVQGAIPRHPDFVCARTYFLCGTSALDWRRRGSPDKEGERESRLEEIKILFTVYESLVRGVEKATELLQEKRPIDEIIAAAKRLIMKDHPSVLEKQLEIQVGTSSPEGAAQVFHLQGIVFDLTTPTGNSLGSVMYADTVIVSLLRVTDENKELSLRGSSTRLGFGLPRFQFWPGEDLVALRKELSETYGEVLVMDTVSMLLPSEDGAVCDVSCVFYEGYLLIHHKRHGNSLLPLTSITYIEGESIGDLSFLLIPCPVGTKDATAHLSKDSYVMLVVQTKTRFKNVMYSKLIPMWKSAGVLELSDHMPTALAATRAFLQSRGPLAANAAAGVDVALARQPGLREFLQQLEVANCVRHRPPLQASDLPAVLPSMPEAEPAAVATEAEAGSAYLVLTVVCGLPGSFKEQLCACLTRLVKDETRWMVLRPADVEALEKLRERLAGAVTAAPRRPLPGQSRKTLRALLCCPGFVGPAQVARLVEGLTTVRIGAVTVCVDPASAFVEHKLTMPMLLDQCANGWVNNIVFTSEGSPDTTNGEDLRAFLRCVCPKVTATHAPKGEVTLAQEIDAILSEDAFGQREMRRARLLGRHGLLYPSSISCVPPALEEEHISFNRPLSRSALMKVLKNMKSTLKPWPYVGNIYFVHGKVTFPQGAGRTLEFWHSALSNATWTQQLDMQPAPPGAPPPTARASGVTFIGCRLDALRLKEWLRAAAPPAPVRRALRSRADVTEAELEQIHKDKHLSPLPAGWFYNGIQYMTMDGTKCNRHPDFERHVEEFVETANDAIRKHNKHIETLEYHDLFEP